MVIDEHRPHLIGVNHVGDVTVPAAAAINDITGGDAVFVLMTLRAADGHLKNTGVGIHCLVAGRCHGDRR